MPCLLYYVMVMGEAGYLVPAKMGRQKLFALSDIQKILNDRGGNKEQKQL